VTLVADARLPCLLTRGIQVVSRGVPPGRLFKGNHSDCRVGFTDQSANGTTSAQHALRLQGFAPRAKEP